MADQGIEKVYQALGDPAAAHQIACQHKKRDGQKRKGVNSRDGLLGYDD